LLSRFKGWCFSEKLDITFAQMLFILRIIYCRPATDDSQPTQDFLKDFRQSFEALEVGGMTLQDHVQQSSSTL
jgi:hypothetical protein